MRVTTKVPAKYQKAPWYERVFRDKDYQLKTVYGTLDVPETRGYYALYVSLDRELELVLLEFTGTQVVWSIRGFDKFEVKDDGTIPYDDIRQDTGQIKQAAKIVKTIFDTTDR